MAVISITITASSTQTIPGVPNSLTLSTNEPCIIYYTLDGTIPNTFSPVYINQIVLPQDQFNITLNLFAVASNGDTSGIVTQTYAADVADISTYNTENVRTPFASVAEDPQANVDLYPLGSNRPAPFGIYTNFGNSASNVVNSPNQPQTPQGFDADGDPAVFVNNATNTDAFKLNQIYNTANFENIVTPGVGNLPKVTMEGQQNLPEVTKESTSNASKVFDPKASVIYIDSTTADPTNPQVIMRQFFSLEDQNLENVKDGSLLGNSSLELPTTTGSLLKSYYNPVTNMVQSYYFDSQQLQWIITATPFESTNPDIGNLYYQAPAVNDRCLGKVFRWYPFLGRHLM